MSALAEFHFLRPGWLLALLPLGLIFLGLLRRTDSSAPWRGLIAPHLLPHLLMTDEMARASRGPVWLLAGVWCLAVLALAGPTWQRQALPFAEDRAALVIVLKVTPSMLAGDIQPSRLTRAVHKIGDLLARRPGALTGLVAYAGSAHRVMPLTRDGEIIRQFATELDPAIMPREGDAPGLALDLALDEFQRSNTGGSILLINDAMPADPDPALAARARQLGVSLHLLAVAAGPGVTPPPDSSPAPALDRRAMEAAARALGGSLTVVSVDDSDVDRLLGQFQRQLQVVAGEDSQWRDAGYALSWLVALGALAWFRRGWRVEAL